MSEKSKSGLTLIKKLPSRKNEKGNYTSWALFQCNVCERLVEKPLRCKDHKSCGCAKYATRTRYFRDVESAKANDALVLVEKLDGGRAKYKCPYCLYEFESTIKAAKVQKSCGCIRWSDNPARRDTIFKIKFPCRRPDYTCNNCGEKVPFGGELCGSVVDGKWLNVCCNLCWQDGRTLEFLANKWLKQIEAPEFQNKHRKLFERGEFGWYFQTWLDELREQVKGVMG